MSLVQAITAPPQIAAALQQASAKTGTDFNYLLKTAMRESSLNCNAKSNTSSACGLFQFTEQSWLGTMKQDGADLGLGQYADAISQNASGRYVVTDPAARREILALRKDPEVSALMAGAYTSDSRDRLEGSLGRSVNGGELYIAHFLGAGGATKLISSAQDMPNAPADALFPAAAAANRSIFYARDGSPRTVSDVYNNLVSKHRNVKTDSRVADATPTSGGLRAGRSTTPAAYARNFSTSLASTNYGAPTPSTSSYAPISGGLGGRTALVLTPDIVEMLASLGVPETSPNNDLQAAQDKRDERAAIQDRHDARRLAASQAVSPPTSSPSASLLLPRGGMALG